MQATIHERHTAHNRQGDTSADKNSDSTMHKKAVQTKRGRPRGSRNKVKTSLAKAAKAESNDNSRNKNSSVKKCKSVLDALQQVTCASPLLSPSAVTTNSNTTIFFCSTASVVDASSTKSAFTKQETEVI
uniref:Putative E3 ubiquitin-protein ligase HUL4 n=1 Tax=Lygus hesperus TaxID=30085 RepID=A0A0A9X3U6_LYGHE